MGSARLHYGLGNISCHIGRGAVHLGGILAAEGAAAVPGIAAVGIHYDLAAGQSRIGRRAAQYKATGGIDVILGLIVQHFGGDAGLDDPLDHILTEGQGIGVLIVLGGKHHRIDPDGLSVFVFHCDLCLAIRTEIGKLPVFADGGQPPGDAVRQGDGQGHPLRGLITGKAEHHTLVAGAQAIGINGFLGLQRHVYPLGDIRRLGVQRAADLTGISIKAILRFGITNFPDDLACDLDVIYRSRGRYFSHDVYRTGLCGGFAGTAGIGIDSEQGVQYTIGDLIADFVGMTFGHRLGCEQCSHASFLHNSVFRGPFTGSRISAVLAVYLGTSPFYTIVHPDSSIFPNFPVAICAFCPKSGKRLGE